MKELEKLLNQLTCRLTEMNDVTKRAKESGRSELYMEVYKRFEDGILDSVHTASECQIEKLLRGHKWVFYDEYNERHTLEGEIIRRRRDANLNEIGI